MTATSLTGAALAKDQWSSINWKPIESHVCRLQMRIAKATRERRYGKAKALQWLLTHSNSAKLLAVRKVTSNKGHKTAGVDNVIWTTEKQKLEAVKQLGKRGYKSSPLRRIYIPKNNGKQRPLGIPTMADRAMQALYLLALEPISETHADRHSYGFRPRRSCHDAIGQCFLTLSRKDAPQWVLEGDIKGCFDNISHNWMLNHIATDKAILKQWLNAGYMEQHQKSETTAGTPQGGIISPTLANLALDGLEAAVKTVTSPTERVNIVRYADDFIITCNSKEVLEDKVKPIVESFLCERGLTLSNEKTHITSIDKGFDFLGFNVRKYNGKLLIQPSKSAIKNVLKELRAILKSCPTIKTDKLIWMLNSKLRGWCLYYRHVVSKSTFSYLDNQLSLALIRWIRRRHPRKNANWMRNKYFRSKQGRNWIFTTKVKTSKGEVINFDLYTANQTPIKRHVKVRADANPYHPKYIEYFNNRSKAGFQKMQL
ncbi:group II intron reverse transcriptase/maturase [Allofrancisella guangzhouensis]|uniref:group II intron reverse transcriptase/maturase n=1 Tax=Allofrancisella guangzhouensis TaxID=594679 RepID=UPI001908337D|nr:group II intron reverse transcriptase/maturase [Allofrancisella guangzhouensis]MBK2046043.1 group II intron reverse transcriptase/maturase [Allofrancisella guangzhouensis]